MKLYFITLAACCFIAMSCKKDRVCNCTVTSNGSVATHSQSAGLELIPGLPAILSSRDTTTYEAYTRVSNETKTYTKVSTNTMRGNCFAKSQEPINQSSTTSVPGIFTITTTDLGTKTSACKIE